MIFDFNGVLVDDEHVHFMLFREVLAEEGIDFTEAQYHDRYLGFDDRGCFETALSDDGQDASRDRVDALIARKAARYVAVAEGGLRFFPSASECLSSLAARYPLAINSGALRPEIEFALNQLRLRPLVFEIVSAEDTQRGKPDPEGYLLALAALRAHPTANLADLDPSECLVIEDSLAGIVSARSAGMHAIGVTNTYTQPELEEAGAEAVITGLATFTPEWVEARFA